MENKASGSAKRGTKQPKLPPPKVVHISNPMKLETSASDFRSIVQELTGQHAVWPVDPSRFSSSHIQTPAADFSVSTTNNITDTGKPNGTADPSRDDVSAGSSDLCFQPLDRDAHADDRVVLIDHHMLHYMLHDHQDFAGSDQSAAVDSRNKF